MNCKPGDLAILLYDCLSHHTGKIVTIVRESTHIVDGWITEPLLVDPDGRLCHPEDSDLRPIRDQDGEDETLTWAGKPSDIKTPEAA